ncbi:MAG: hypothetical protein ACD_75C01447G0001, partial [uncultured bacterium]
MMFSRILHRFTAILSKGISFRASAANLSYTSLISSVEPMMRPISAMTDTSSAMLQKRSSLSRNASSIRLRSMMWAVNGRKIKKYMMGKIRTDGRIVLSIKTPHRGSGGKIPINNGIRA